MAGAAKAPGAKSEREAAFFYAFPLYEFARTAQQRTATGAGTPLNRVAHRAALADHTSRQVTAPNNDTIYGVGLADLTQESVVVQTPAEVPQGHYWTIQIVDLFTTVTHQLGSASGTPGGSTSLLSGFCSTPRM